MASTRKLKLQARKAAKKKAASGERLAAPCAYCDGTSRASGDGKTPCGFCGEGA